MPKSTACDIGKLKGVAIRDYGDGMYRIKASCPPFDVIATVTRGESDITLSPAKGAPQYSPDIKLTIHKDGTSDSALSFSRVPLTLACMEDGSFTKDMISVLTCSNAVTDAWPEVLAAAEQQD